MKNRIFLQIKASEVVAIRQIQTKENTWMDALEQTLAVYDVGLIPDVIEEKSYKAYGLRSRFVEATGKADMSEEEKLDVFQNIYEASQAGMWNRERATTSTGRAANVWIIKAMAELRGIEEVALTAAWTQLTPEQKTALITNEVKAKAKALEAAAKSADGMSDLLALLTTNLV